MSLRIIFMGTPEFAVPTLVELVGHGHQIVACYTQPPRPAGRRGLEQTKSPVHEMAEQFGIEIATPISLRDASEQEKFGNYSCDVAVVVAYGLLLPQVVLDSPVLGCYNGHASLLPRWRGAAPIQRAIMAGDSETGVGIMKMEAGLDTGPVALEERVRIDPDLTASQLHDKLASMTANLMIRALSALERGSLELRPQADSVISYAAKISKEETRIDWSLSAQEIHNQIRGLSSFPGAWCEMEIGGKSQRVKILASQIAQGVGSPGEIVGENLEIACGEGSIRLLNLQRAGKRQQDVESFLAGNRVTAVT